MYANLIEKYVVSLVSEKHDLIIIFERGFYTCSDRYNPGKDKFVCLNINDFRSVHL
jgi:hypothetical protein